MAIPRNTPAAEPLETTVHLDWAREEIPRAELRLLACMLANPELISRACELVRSSDCAAAWSGRLIEEMIVRREQLLAVEDAGARIAILSRELIDFDLAAHEKLDAIYWAGLYDPPEVSPTPSAMEHFALEVVEAAREAYRKLLIENREFGEEQLAKLMAFEKRIASSADADTYIDTAVTGTPLLESSSIPVPDPVVDGLLWPGHVNVLAGRTKIGKTFLVCHVLVRLTTQRKVWLDEPSGLSQRILVLSRDDTTPELARRFRLLEPHNLDWARSILVIGKEQRPPRLDQDGLRVLRSSLEVARRRDAPMTGVVIDPYTHFVPEGARINEDECASALIAGLEELSVEFECWIWLLHHLRKMTGDRKRKDIDDEDLLDELRGSGAIANLARAVAILEKREPHLRRLISFSNVGPTPPAKLLQVCDEGQNLINRWVPVTSTTTSVVELIGPDEEITFSEYCRRRLGLSFAAKPSQAQRRTLSPEFNAAIQDGLLVPGKPVRGAKSVRLSSSALDSARVRSAHTDGSALGFTPPKGGGEGPALLPVVSPPGDVAGLVGASGEKGTKRDEDDAELLY